MSDLPKELVELFWRIPEESEPRLTARQVLAEWIGQEAWFATHSVEEAKAAYRAALTTGTSP